MLDLIFIRQTNARWNAINLKKKSLGNLINTTNDTKSQHWFHNTSDEFVMIVHYFFALLPILRFLIWSPVTLCDWFFFILNRLKSTKNAMRMRTLIVSLDGVSSQESWKKRLDKKNDQWKKLNLPQIVSVFFF